MCPQTIMSTASNPLKLAKRSASVNCDYFWQIWRRAGGAKSSRWSSTELAHGQLDSWARNGVSPGHFRREFAAVSGISNRFCITNRIRRNS
jgi:hypothetical protein